MNVLAYLAILCANLLSWGVCVFCNLARSACRGVANFLYQRCKHAVCQLLHCYGVAAKTTSSFRYCWTSWCSVFRIFSIPFVTVADIIRNAASPLLALPKRCKTYMSSWMACLMYVPWLTLLWATLCQPRGTWSRVCCDGGVVTVAQVWNSFKKQSSEAGKRFFWDFASALSKKTCTVYTRLLTLRSGPGQTSVQLTLRYCCCCLI